MVLGVGAALARWFWPVLEMEAGSRIECGRRRCAALYSSRCLAVEARPARSGVRRSDQATARWSGGRLRAGAQHLPRIIRALTLSPCARTQLQMQLAAAASASKPHGGALAGGPAADAPDAFAASAPPCRPAAGAERQYANAWRARQKAALRPLLATSPLSAPAPACRAGHDAHEQRSAATGRASADDSVPTPAAPRTRQMQRADPTTRTTRCDARWPLG